MRGFTIFIIVTVALVVLFFLGIARAPDMFADNLSKKLNVPVSLEKMHFGFSKISMRQFEIANPKGYSLPRAFSAKRAEVHTPLTEYFKDDITVDLIEIDEIYLGIEFHSTSSTDGNWTQIMKSFQEKAKLNQKGGEKILIKKVVFTDINTELLFQSGGKGIQKLPNIPRIELTNISTEGNLPVDQLVGSVLGQMLKQVFLEQNLDSLLKGLIESPGQAVDSFLEPFKGFFNANPKQTEKSIA